MLLLLKAPRKERTLHMQPDEDAFFEELDRDFEEYALSRSHRDTTQLLEEKRFAETMLGRSDAETRCLLLHSQDCECA